MEKHAVLIPLLSGGLAGTVTDLFFFPVDTVKTRLQAKGGFFANGGWSGIYRGVGSAFLASAPGASLFFLTYETISRYLHPMLREHTSFGESTVHNLAYMAASSGGEIAACSIRVPAEVVKQRAQTSVHASSREAFVAILQNRSGEGIRRGLYRGWTSTVMREIPFTMIQFPLYESLKRKIAAQTGRPKISLGERALCGSAAGAVAAACTTPLDVIKTRLMLHHKRESISFIIKDIIRNEGYSALFKGVGPRTLWISAGGAIFLGAYETCKELFTFIYD